MKKIILSALVIAFAATGCKKDKETVCSLDATSILGTYKVTSAKYKASSSAAEQEVLNDTNWFDACERDDTYGFSSGSSFTYTDAGTSCGGASTTTGTWALSGTTLVVVSTGISFSTPVSNFSCSGFQITATDVDVTGDQLVLTMTRQ